MDKKNFKLEEERDKLAAIVHEMRIKIQNLEQEAGIANQVDSKQVEDIKFLDEEDQELQELKYKSVIETLDVKVASLIKKNNMLIEENENLRDEMRKLCTV
jgi:hypothetical protein